MDYLDTFLQYYGTALVCVAIAWLVWRSSQVLFKPIDELASLLGIEVPVAPTLALAGLKADGFLLQWNPVEQKGATVLYYLTVNGVNGSIVGDLSPLDQSLQVCGLLPKHGYVVRIAAKLNNFVDTSLPLFIQTKPASSDDFFETAETQAHATTERTPTVSVRPYRALLDTATASGHSVPMQREHSGSISNQQKRNVSARRQTQSSHPANVVSETFKEEVAADEDTMAELTEKLDRLRAETEQCDAQITLEETKFHEDQEALTKALHDVQQLLHDRGNATRKLNQHVAALVTEESSARKQKALLDKQLDKVKQERQKMSDEMARWQSDAREIDQKIEKMSDDQTEYEADAQKKVAVLKADFVNEKATNDALEESIRLTIASIREYEEKTKALNETEAEEGTNAQKIMTEEEESWKIRLTEVQQRCAALATQQHPLHESLLKDQITLEWWRQYHFSQTQSYQVPQIDVAPRRRNSGRQSDRLSLSGFDNNSGSYGISPNFAAATPFLNITNGMTIPNEGMAMSPEPDSGFSNVPTSPSVLHTFLPSGLFGDDAESKFGTIGQRTALTRDDSGSQSVLPGLGAPGTLDDFPQGSPVSQHSQSPIVFASPGASNPNLPFNNAGTFAETDRRSIRSGTGSSRAVSGGASGTKFAGFFHLGRQRSKAGSDEGPILGSLRASESQSTPRSENVADVPMAAIGTSRRRGSHSGPSWVGQMLSRSNTSAPAEETQKKRFNVFGGPKKSETWSEAKDADSHGLPRPSAETSSRFRWPNSTDEFAQSQVTGAAGSTWRYSNPGSWPAQYHSRNSSKQVGHSIDDAVDGSHSTDSAARSTTGARPQTPVSSQSRPQTSTPLKLNPNAPTFTGGAFGTAEDEASERLPTSQHKDLGNLQGTSAAAGSRQSYDDRSEDGRSSPFSSRKSRDAQSLLSVDAASESANRESFEQSNSSTAPSENGNPTKESFMRKLTRKGSAGFSSLAGRRAAGSKKHSIAALAAAEAADEAQASDEDTLRTTLTMGEESGRERSAMSPLLGSGGSMRGFSLKSLRRRKGDKTPAESVDGDEDEKN